MSAEPVAGVDVVADADADADVVDVAPASEDSWAYPVVAGSPMGEASEQKWAYCSRSCA